MDITRVNRLWHVINDDGTLDNGKTVSIGDNLWYTKDFQLSESFMSNRHASGNLLDALLAAPGNMVCLTRYVGGSSSVIIRNDEIYACYSKVVAIADCKELFMKFAVETITQLLPIWEKAYPMDTRPQKAIQVIKTHRGTLNQNPKDYMYIMRHMLSGKNVMSYEECNTEIQRRVLDLMGVKSCLSLT